MSNSSNDEIIECVRDYVGEQECWRSMTDDELEQHLEDAFADFPWADEPWWDDEEFAKAKKLTRLWNVWKAKFFLKFKKDLF